MAGGLIDDGTTPDEPDTVIRSSPGTSGVNSKACVSPFPICCTAGRTVARAGGSGIPSFATARQAAGTEARTRRAIMFGRSVSTSGRETHPDSPTRSSSRPPGPVCSRS